MSRNGVARPWASLESAHMSEIVHDLSKFYILSVFLVWLAQVIRTPRRVHAVAAHVSCTHDYRLSSKSVYQIKNCPRYMKKDPEHWLLASHPGPSQKAGKGTGTHCLRMCVIFHFSLCKGHCTPRWSYAEGYTNLEYRPID